MLRGGENRIVFVVGAYPGLGFGLGAHNRAWGLGKEFWIWFGYAISGELLLIYLLPTVLTLAIECTLVIVF